MLFPTVLPALEKELKGLERSLMKSFKSFWAGDISLDTHDTHKKNINRLISEHKRGIELLKKG